MFQRGQVNLHPGEDQPSHRTGQRTVWQFEVLGGTSSTDITLSCPKKMHEDDDVNVPMRR